MKLLSIFFQYCSIKVFEPLNVYEKCKVFMCSMRCSDNKQELLCMIQSLNEILTNQQTRKDIRIILLKEHLSYLLKLTSTPLNQHDSDEPSPSSIAALNTSHIFTVKTEDGVMLIKSLLDLLESMVILMSQESKDLETLTIFVHILSMHLYDISTDTSNTPNDQKKRSKELNDLVLDKLLKLGVNYKQEFKQILDKYPNLKTKIGNAFKLQTSIQQSKSSQNNHPGQSQQTQQQQQSKAPKIQLNFNFSNFK